METPVFASIIMTAWDLILSMRLARSIVFNLTVLGGTSIHRIKYTCRQCDSPMYHYIIFLYTYRYNTQAFTDRHSWIYKSSLTLDKTCHIYIFRVCKSSIQITDVSLLHCQGVHSHRPRSLICHFTCYILHVQKVRPRSLTFHQYIVRMCIQFAQITDISPLRFHF